MPNQDLELTRQLKLAREVFEADQAERLRKPTRPCHRLPTELLHNIHADLTEVERRLNDTVRTRKIVVSGGPKHFSSLSKEDAMKCTNYGLRDMLMPGVNTGKGLLMQISSDSCLTSAVHFLAFDVHGWTLPVTVYHAGEVLQSQLHKGTVFFLREPHIKHKDNGPFIRVDCPLDLITWPDDVRSFESVSHITPPACALTLKASADQHFVCGRYQEALHLYRQALYWHVGIDDMRSLLALNAAAVMLKLNMAGAALRILHTMCFPDHLSAMQRQKRLHRILQAGTRLQRVPSLEELFCGVHDDIQNVRLLETARELVALHQRLREGPVGGITLEQTTQQRSSGDGPLSYSEFHHKSVLLTKLEGKGFALCAAHKIESGTLLLAARPLASATVSRGPAYTLSLNLASNNLDNNAQTLVIANLLDRLRDEPYLQMDYEALYAGDVDFQMRKSPSLAREYDIYSKTWPSFDAGRLEIICTLNSFTPRGLLNVPIGENAPLDHFYWPSALYLSASYMNHSCVGNATYSFIQDTLFLFAARDIEVNEEIVDSYCDASASLAERRTHLARYGFVCTCALCFKQEAEAVSKNQF